MSGSQGIETGDQFAQIILGGQVGAPLTRLLLADAITPGDAPSYELCKIIYAFHPLGAKLVETPINMAQSQQRELSLSVEGEETLIGEFKRVWRQLGEGVGADSLIKSLKTQSRIYGISSLVMGDRNKPGATDAAIDWANLHTTRPYFSIFDPLNTAGSLILDQDPNSPDFQKPTAVQIGSRRYHPSRTLVTINEPPIYILWSNSAYGFSGRSVYQRAVFPLKTFLQSMVTDWLVTVKCGLLIHKAKAPGSIQNNRVLHMFGFKRQQLKGGVTGQVLTIDVLEAIESLNFQNLEGPATMARTNALKDIAMAASMPAKLLESEELTEGFSEGTEDAKQIARFIDRLRIEMEPEYAYMTRVVQHLAWTPALFERIKREFPAAYGKISFTAAFYQWQNSFVATWPNLLEEPDSKKMEAEKIRFESVTALAEVAAPLIKVQQNRAALLDWIATEIGTNRKLFSTPLELDLDAEAKYVAPEPEMGAGADQEPRLEPFSSRT